VIYHSLLDFGFVIIAMRVPAVHAAVHTVSEHRRRMFMEKGTNLDEAAAKQLKMIC
jgi:hypothetical protein